MSTVDRRTFVRGAAFGLAAVAMTPALAACSGGTSSQSIATKLAAFPTYVQITKGPKPDLPGSKTVQPVYFKPDTNLYKSVTGKIGEGKSASALVITYSPPPPADNDYLKFVSEKANIDFKMSITPADQFANKFAATVAGGDVPDYVEFLVFALPPRFPNLLASQFADLTPYLSGDAVKKYPNLANIPTPSWVTARVNGKIYGVPAARPPFGSVLFTRPDEFRKLGVDGDLPKNQDEFLAFCKELTSAKAGRYALGGAVGPISAATPTPRAVSFASEFIYGMFRVPNVWDYKNGKLTSSFTTPEYLEAVAYTKKLWDAGVYHPDTASMDLAKTITLNRAGSILMYNNGISGLQDAGVPANVELDAMVPFGADGGKAYNYQGASAFSFTAIKKAPKARVEELLRVMNYLAAPVGSQEQVDINAGQEGVHYTRRPDGSLQATEKGTAEVAPTNIFRIATGPSVLNAGSPAPTKETLTRMHAYEEKVTPMLVADPTLSYYSPTAASSASANLQITDAATNYILGRGSLSTLKSAITKWKGSVGDKIASEYLKSLKKYT